MNVEEAVNLVWTDRMNVGKLLQNGSVEILFDEKNPLTKQSLFSEGLDDIWEPLNTLIEEACPCGTVQRAGSTLNWYIALSVESFSKMWWSASLLYTKPLNCSPCSLCFLGSCRHLKRDALGLPISSLAVISTPGLIPLKSQDFSKSYWVLLYITKIL